MEVCTGDYATPKYEFMDWCATAEWGIMFWIQLFVELLIIAVLMWVGSKLIRKYRIWANRRRIRKMEGLYREKKNQNT